VGGAGILGTRWLISSFSLRSTFVILALFSALSPLFERQRVWMGDVLGFLLFSYVLGGVFLLFGYLHGLTLSPFGREGGPLPFMACLITILLALALMGLLGPRHFPLRYLTGTSIRAILLRHFLPVSAGAVLVLNLPGLMGDGRMSGPLSSLLGFSLFLFIVVTLSFRSAETIGRRIAGSLKESEERYTVLVNSLKDHAVLLLDPAGHVLTWNAGAELILGYESHEVLGEVVSIFYSPENRKDGRLRKVFRQAARQINEEQEWLVRKDGSRFWAETVTSPFFDSKGVLLGYSQVVRDITLRRKVEEAAKEQAVFSQILQGVTSACNGAETLGEALPIVLHQICLHTGWPVGHAWVLRPEGEGLMSGPWHMTDAGRFASFNAETDGLRLLPGKDLPGLALSSGEPEWFPRLSTERSFLRRKSAMDAGLEAGYAFPLRSGRKVVAVLEFFSEQGRELNTSWREATGTICLQLERLVERESAAKALRNSERRFRSLTQTANDAIVSYSPSGVIFGWNRGARLIFGLEEQEILGLPLTRIVSLEEDPSSPRPKLPAALLTDMRGKTVELTGCRKEGSLFPMEVSVAAVTGGPGVSFTAIIRDVTVQKRAQSLLTASLREKEAMLKEIHHRVKNNLQMISSLLRLQSENIQDPALLSLFLESQNRVRSMAMIHECLYETEDLAHIDFSDYVEKLAGSLLRTYALSPEAMSLDLQIDRVSLSLDIAVPCGLIITELVSNALKYAYPPGQGGPILVKFHVLEGDRYELRVEDKGVGIKEAVDFESVETLGLRLVHILTEQLHGKILVENGIGTSFVLTFNGPDGRV
jgi:PAS domain S-box-containing protein